MTVHHARARCRVRGRRHDPHGWRPASIGSHAPYRRHPSSRRRSISHRAPAAGRRATPPGHRNTSSNGTTARAPLLGNPDASRWRMRTCAPHATPTSVPMTAPCLRLEIRRRLLLSAGEDDNGLHQHCGVRHPSRRGAGAPAPSRERPLTPPGSTSGGGASAVSAQCTGRLPTSDLDRRIPLTVLIEKLSSHVKNSEAAPLPSRMKARHASWRGGE